MLILIAGISGNLGHHLARAALRRGILIRGLGSSIGKVSSDVASALESFVTYESIFDGDAIQKAVTGVDAVICAYAATLELYLEGQLFLLRAAEKAGVRIFHAQSWNFNWRRLSFTEMEYYDANISFYRQVELTSTIRPVYVFTGIFAHGIYAPTGPIRFAVEEGKARMEYWGDGETRYQWTSMRDSAEFSIEILTTESDVINGKGGVFCVYSGYNTIKEFAEAYERVSGINVELVRNGGVEDLELKVREIRQLTPASKYFSYLMDVLVMLAVQGKWVIENLRSYDHIPKTTLEEVVKDTTNTQVGFH